MRNNYGILLPIIIELPDEFESGDSIKDLLDKETRDELFKLANKTGNVKLNISKIPFIKITDPDEPAQTMGYGSLESNDSGTGYLYIYFTTNTYIYTFVINSVDETINLSISRIQLRN